jgi:hypothetical protein
MLGNGRFSVIFVAGKGDLCHIQWAIQGHKRNEKRPLPPHPFLLEFPSKISPFTFAHDLSLCYKWEKFHNLQIEEEISAH